MRNPLTRFPRFFGFLFAAACFALAYWYADHTLWLAETKQPERIFVVKSFPFMIALDLVFSCGFIGGPRFTAYSQNLRARKKTAKDFVFFAAILIPSLAAYAWLVSELKLRGYEIL